MRRILIDTNIYSAFKRNVQYVTDILKRVDSIGINTVVLGELYSGFKGGKKEELNKSELDQFMDLSRVNILLIDEITSEFYAYIYLNLKKIGKPVPTNDIWIAASALQHGLALFTLDAHFKSVAGLMLK